MDTRAHESNATGGAPDGIRTFRMAVLIAAWNAERFILEALDSARAQTRQPDEIIVVDDGSTDGTCRLVREWSAMHSAPLTLLRQARRGCAAARNRGLRSTSADLVALLDADDLFLPEHLQRAEAAFAKNRDLVLCFGDVDVFSGQGVQSRSFLAGKAVEQLEYRQDNDGLRMLVSSPFGTLLSGNYIPVSTSVYRLSALRDIGMYDETLINAADRDLNLRVCRVGPVAYYPVCVARKRAVDGSLSDPTQSPQAYRYRFRVVEKMLECADELELSPAEIQRAREVIGTHAGYMLRAAWRLGWREYGRAMRELFVRGHLLSVAPWRIFLGRLFKRSP